MDHLPFTELTLGPTATLYLGDALEVLTSLPSNFVDAVVTDPPYAIKRVPANRYKRPAPQRPECHNTECVAGRVCGACQRADTIAKFATAPMLGQQSQNWHATETHSRGYADNDPVQFQRWCELWLPECLRILKPGGHIVAFGGTRTWHRLVTAAEDTGFEIRDSLAWLYSTGMPKSLNVEKALTAAGNSHQAQAWAGTGTALRPAFEPILLARRQPEGTMANNIATWNLGPLNLNTARTPAASNGPSRWPSNVHMDAQVATHLNADTGQDPARAFWVSKPNQSERPKIDDVSHPTVKPLDLMQRLIRLVTPAGGLVLDPFAGSGSTIEACMQENIRSVGIERDENYIPLIQERVRRQATNVSVQPEPDPLALF